MSRNIPGLTLAYTASGEIPARVLVKYGPNDGDAALATTKKDTFLGVSRELAYTPGQHVDVIRSGVTSVIYGAAIPAAAGDQIAGYAEVSGSAGDIGSIFVQRGAL